MGLIMTYRPSQKKKAVFFQSLITMKVLVATEKPFAKAAVDGIREIIEGAGYQLALLEKYTDKSQLLEAVADVDALIVRSDKVTAEVIAAAPQLKVVVRAGAGYDNVDLATCTQRGIVVMNTPGQNSNAVAELAIGMMIFMLVINLPREPVLKFGGNALEFRLMVMSDVLLDVWEKPWAWRFQHMIRMLIRRCLPRMV